MKLKFLLFVITLILMDQCVKAVVHFNMPLHSEISLVGDFIKLYHIENPGMAFGINFDYKYTKLFLSLFRLIASFLIGAYLIQLLDKKSNMTLLFCVSLILSGAIGNVIDSVFYGVLYDNAPVSAPFLSSMAKLSICFMLIFGRLYLRKYSNYWRDIFIIMASF